VKKNFALLLVALLAFVGGVAAAQEALPPGSTGSGDLPPAMGDSASEAPGEASHAAPGETIEPIAEGVADGTIAGSFESSGTWLSRGYWYAEGDYVLMNKSWDKKGLLFAFEGTTSAAPGFTNPTGASQPGFGPVLTLNTVQIDGAKPGANGLAKVTLGRFLFRDYKNRDHDLQFTYFGGGDWKQNSRVEAATAGGFNVNDFIDRVNPSFDGAQVMAFNYDTKLDSVESNYVVKSRLSKDQIVLQPDGNWVRQAHTSQTYSFLAGLRFLNLTDQLDITADRNPDVATSEGGFYNVDSKNRLLGGQLGVGVSQETSRWSIGMNVKGGSFWNRMHVLSDFVAGTEAAPSTGTVNSTEDTIAFAGEFQVIGKWHLRPNVSIRTGLQMLYVSDIALSPHQVNFVAGGYPPIAGRDDIFCIGSFVGLEAYR
jgi:hypothetical protein